MATVSEHVGRESRKQIRELLWVMQARTDGPGMCSFFFLTTSYRIVAGANAENQKVVGCLTCAGVVVVLVNSLPAPR